MDANPTHISPRIGIVNQAGIWSGKGKSKGGRWRNRQPAACFLSTFSRHERVAMLILHKQAPPTWGVIGPERFMTDAAVHQSRRYPSFYPPLLVGYSNLNGKDSKSTACFSYPHRCTNSRHLSGNSRPLGTPVGAERYCKSCETHLHCRWEDCWENCR